jgi:hypothetical protein
MSVVGRLWSVVNRLATAQFGFRLATLVQGLPEPAEGPIETRERVYEESPAKPLVEPVETSAFFSR